MDASLTVAASVRPEPRVAVDEVVEALEPHDPVIVFVFYDSRRDAPESPTRCGRR